MARQLGYTLKDGFRWLPLYQGDEQGVRHSFWSIAKMETERRKKLKYPPYRVTDSTIKYWIRQAQQEVEKSGILQGVK